MFILLKSVYFITSISTQIYHSIFLIVPFIHQVINFQLVMYIHSSSYIHLFISVISIITLFTLLSLLSLYYVLRYLLFIHHMTVSTISSVTISTTTLYYGIASIKYTQYSCCIFHMNV